MMAKCKNFIKRTFGHCKECSSKRGPVEFVQDVELIKRKSMTMLNPNSTEQTVCFNVMV
jgi:hypothetical protein